MKIERINPKRAESLIHELDVYQSKLYLSVGNNLKQ